MKQKLEALDKFIEFKAAAEKETGMKIKAVRNDSQQHAEVNE